MAEAVEIPFWAKRESVLLRKCDRCGHRGMFEFSDDPVMVADKIVCLACGSVAFRIVLEEPEEWVAMQAELNAS